MKKLLFFISLVLITTNTHAQTFLFKQYFDGNDTLFSNRLQIEQPGTSIWQIGPPQKNVFDTSATSPNAIVTDTINTYPINDTSTFTIGLNTSTVNWAITAIRWTQKLDMDSAADGGIVEISVDSGQTWVNIFNDTTVYNFYGFNKANVDTLTDGTVAFTGTDSLWKDIWLCYGYTTISQTDSMILRFTFRSDSTDNQKDGWMIDNMFVTRTFVHTVGKIDPNRSFIVYPTITSGSVTINSDNDVIRLNQIQLIDASGKLIRAYKEQPKKVKLDFSDCAAGTYYIKVSADDKTEVHQVVIMH